MDKPNFNQDWYGMQAKVLSQSDDCVVVDYGCNGRGIVKNYNLFEGKLVDCLEKCLICRHIRRFAD